MGTVVAGGIASTAGVQRAAAATERSGSVPSGAILPDDQRREHELHLDPRVTLLDLLREQLQLTGTKKGCDHGQCGACTVLVNGVRVNSCLSLAVMHDGDAITTIEGLANGDNCIPCRRRSSSMTAFSAGIARPGQICSGRGDVGEVKAGAPSSVTREARGRWRRSN